MQPILFYTQNGVNVAFLGPKLTIFNLIYAFNFLKTVPDDKH